MSNLLKMSLALEDSYLKRRVHAASIIRAQQVQNRQDAQGGFAQLILSDTTRVWPVFLQNVATNAEVLEAITLSPKNDQIFATDVTDKQIESIVASTLAQNAEKYAPTGDNQEKHSD